MKNLFRPSASRRPSDWQPSQQRPREAVLAELERIATAILPGEFESDGLGGWIVYITYDQDVQIVSSGFNELDGVFYINLPPQQIQATVSAVVSGGTLVTYSCFGGGGVIWPDYWPGFFLGVQGIGAMNQPVSIQDASTSRTVSSLGEGAPSLKPFQCEPL